MAPDREGESTTGDAHQPRRSKVGRLLEEYDLTGVGAGLERRWLGVDGERRSLRDLADGLNRLLLSAALERAGERSVEGEVENYYRLLTDDEVGTAARTEAEAKLARIGIDVESVRQDFVSHQAVHTYLTKYRGVEPPGKAGSADAALENRSETLQRLQQRLVAVAERSLESLRDAGHLSIDSFDVMVRVTVYCDTCGTTSDAFDLLARRGCECEVSED